MGGSHCPNSESTRGVAQLHKSLRHGVVFVKSTKIWRLSCIDQKLYTTHETRSIVYTLYWTESRVSNKRIKKFFSLYITDN